MSFYDHFTYIFLAVTRITTVGLELSRFCFCRLNILEVTGKAQANAEESNLDLYNAPQVFTGHKKNKSEICYFGIWIVIVFSKHVLMLSGTE